MITSIKLENVYKSYGTGDFSLEMDSLNFKKGDIYTILGPNGSGKTTLLKLIGYLDRPDRGMVLYNGKDSFTESYFQKNFRIKTGFMMQKPYLFNTNVFNNLAIGLKIRNYSKQEISVKIGVLLNSLNIDHLRNKSTEHLSGGERQKVAIAQVLLLEPEVIFLDEPTVSIDSKSEYLFENAIKESQEKLDSIVIMTTHSIEQAKRMSSNTIFIEDGRISEAIH